MIDNTISIVWEKWVDPFGGDIDESKWNNYNEDESYDALFEENPELKSKFIKPIKVISTPMGLIPYNEHTSSSKIFNFWIGHTNFSITQQIVDIIEKCDGVEILDVFTRYRFRIGIGKCFYDSDVMSNIKDRIDKLYL